jgi:neutral ceramidase
MKRLVYWVAVLLLATPAAGAVLRGGVAKVDITPPTGVAMWGYAARKALSTGTLDPLYARVLVLEAGEKRLAWVVLDLGRTFGPAAIQQLRESVRKSSSITYTLVQATHTHSGPVIRDEYPSGKVPAWETAALEKIGAAIHEASQNLVEVRLGTGYGQVAIGYNRIRVNPDGTVTMLWRNETKVPTSPVDRSVSVIRVDKTDGSPLAILVNHACHPVIFGSTNLKYSADFPGVMARTVEEAFGGAPLAFFVQGAPGDINPYLAGTPPENDPIASRDWTGRELGEEAARIAKSIRTQTSSQASLDFAEDPLRFRLRWDPEKLREALIASYGPEILESYAPRIKPEVELPVTTVLINKRIALMGMPGEPFVEFQMNWRARCPARAAFFLGYANGYNGYFPTIRAASIGGYGAASATTWAEAGAGERMVDHALVRVYEMLGRLTDLPEDLKKK